MRILRESSLDEYARGYWDREKRKNDAGKHVWEEINTRGTNPVVAILEEHPYKLPRKANDIVRIALLENREETEALLIHDYMPTDVWMQKMDLVPKMYTRKLGELAPIFLKPGKYFDKQEDPKKDDLGTQYKCYHEWKKKEKKDALKGLFAGTEKPLIECIRPGEYEIVDGWGRLMPFVALLQEGYEFHPVEIFLAARGCDVCFAS